MSIQNTIKQHRNTIRDHVALAPELLVVAVSPYRGDDVRYFERSLAVPGNTKLWVKVHEIPELLQSASTLARVYHDHYGTSFGAPFGDAVFTGQKFLAEVKGVQATGKTVLAAISKAVKEYAKKHTISVPTAAEWKKLFADAEAEINSNPNEKRRVFVKTQVNNQGSVFSNLAPSPRGYLTANLREHGSFHRDPGADEPYSYQGTFHHDMHVVDVEPELKNGEYWSLDDSVVIQRTLDYRTDLAATRLFAVVVKHNGPHDDYYEGHQDYSTVEGIFDDADKADEFLALMNTYSVRYNHYGHTNETREVVMTTAARTLV